MTETVGPTANPYAAPGAATEPEAEAGDADLTRDELLAFAGPASAFYWWRWDRSGRRRGLWLSWNWPAAIFTLLWFAYRRMWREFAVIFAADTCWQLLQALAAGLLGLEHLLGSWPDTIGDLLLFSIAMGALGNALYIRRARLEARQARAVHPGDPTWQRARLKEVGGTSWWWVLVGIGALVAGGVAEQALVDVLWPLLF
jgi:hypothetical protein